MDARFAPMPKDMVFDLMRLDRAKTKNCADWRTSDVQRGGRPLRTIFQHPDGNHDGDATYEIALPALPLSGKLVIKFGTVITNASDNGVRFTVLVNGNEMWSETKTAFLSPKPAAEKSAQDSLLPTADPFSDHTVDLSNYAGQTVSLTLRVNAMGNAANDLANWVEPRIVRVI